MSIKSNLYALLPDDAEDATEAVVRRAPQQEKAKSSSSTSSRVTNKVKIPQIVDSVQVEEEEDTTLAEQEDKEKHSPHKVEKHHVQVTKKHGREFDRHSGTGRGKEISKGGAGGRYVFGSPEEEARKLGQGVNTALKSGMKDEEAVKSVEQNIVEQVEGEETEQETAQEKVEQEEEPKETLTLDEYLARQAEKKLQLANLLGNKPLKSRETTSVDDSLKPWKREDEDDPTLSEIGQKNLQQNAVNNNNRQKDNRNKAVDMTKEFFSEPPRRGGRGRGNRRVGRGSGPRGFVDNSREMKSEEETVFAQDRKDNRQGSFTSRPLNSSRGSYRGPPRRGGFSSRGGGGRVGGRGSFSKNRVSTPSISDPTDFPTLS